MGWMQSILERDQIRQKAQDERRAERAFIREKRTNCIGYVWVRNDTLVVGDRIVDIDQRNAMVAHFREIAGIEKVSGKLQLWLKSETETKQEGLRDADSVGNYRTSWEVDCDMWSPIAYAGGPLDSDHPRYNAASEPDATASTERDEHEENN